MAYELSEIKEIRKKFDLTQTQLANISGVSQSLIAKIEAGRLDPTYSNARKIFEAIDSLGKKKELRAEQIMTKNIISVKPNDDIKEAIAKMKKSNISQMPVIEEHKSIGVVSESIILESLLNKKGSKIKDIMDDSAPVVSKNTNVNAVSNLLRFYPMVLVSDDGELKGIITKSDLLGKLYK
ncbi:MAG: CBS domain-containing protein [Nanoarchaeota archaeon]|nr:CBS domain-containing protein [Nanoarchaeota archaeon]MBU1005500.1 CBS domain-containing protein [Nanoarchaeota archaeon]MBU1945714.1 CBS domain-containing protein [Nanoarchaeota archaeon]